MEADSPEDSTRRWPTPQTWRPSRAAGRDARRNSFAYVSAPQAGVPFIEIAYIPPEMQAFYDYIKQEQRSEHRDTGNRQRGRRDVVVGRRRRGGDRFRHRRRLRGGQRRRSRRAGAGARARRRGGRHHVDGRRALLPRRRDRGPAGDRSRRLPRGDVQVPGRGVARARSRQDPRLLRRQRRAFQLAGRPGFPVRAQLLPRQSRWCRPAPRG